MSLSPLWCCAGDMKMSASHGSRYRGFAVTHTHKKNNTTQTLYEESSDSYTYPLTVCYAIGEQMFLVSKQISRRQTVERDQTVNSGMASCTLATSL